MESNREKWMKQRRESKKQFKRNKSKKGKLQLKFRAGF